MGREELGRQIDADGVFFRNANRAVEVDHLPDAVLAARDDLHLERTLRLPDPEAHPMIDGPADIPLLEGVGLTRDEHHPGLVLTHQRLT